MRTVTPMRLLAALLLGGLCLTACSGKEEAPAPADPTPSFTMGHYFDFATPTPGGGTSHSGSGQTHAAQNITGEARLDEPGKVLVLQFNANPDEVYFELDQDQLRPGWTGTYDLRCNSRPADPVFVSYLYINTSIGSTAILRLSDWSQDLTGNVTITAYDAKRHLVSGSYEVKAPNQRNPMEPGPTSPTCTILIAGDFSNLKVK